MSCQQELINTPLEAMRRQECSTYACEDYLRSKLPKASSPTSIIMSEMFMTADDNTMTQEDITVCINNRSKMAQWCMTLMDACQLNRETVTIAMSCFDRYLATEQGAECIEDSTAFQLACMTALYTAIKVHEEKAISPQVLSTISRGFYSQADMEAMEWRMLQAIQFRVNVPTPLGFAREYLQLIPTSAMDTVTREQLISLVKVQTEMAVSDYNFVTIKPSSVGFAALVNAMDVLGLDCSSLIRPFISNTVVDTDEVFRIQSALFVVVSNMTSLRSMCGGIQQSPRSVNTAQPAKRRQSHTISPRAVCESAQIA